MSTRTPELAALCKARLTIILLFLALPLGFCYADSATWNQNPTNGDWNTADNWTPNTVPNGPSDVATFSTSDNDLISLSATTDVDTVHFLTYATPFFIGVGLEQLNFDGAGVINDSGTFQAFTEIRGLTGGNGIVFHNSASAGTDTNYLLAGGGAEMSFEDSSSAGGANIELSQGQVQFYDSSSASDAMFEVGPGGVIFNDNSSAGNATFSLISGAVSFGYNSTAANVNIACSGSAGVSFGDTATAANGTFTANGATSSTGSASFVTFAGATTAANGTFVLNGGSADGAAGAAMNFYNPSNADSATISVNGGTNGGAGASVIIHNGGRGGTARFILSGNGTFDISNHNSNLVTIGSIEGNGGVLLGPGQLGVGSNNLSTTFSGFIQDGSSSSGGSLSKLGTGTLTLSGASTYTGATSISAGALLASNRSGSATGTGNVAVNGGTLGGGGTIAGAVTVGTGSNSGAILQPGFGTNKKVTLTIQGLLTFNADATYNFDLKSNKAEVVANGVTIVGGAQFTMTGPSRKLPAGKTATVISNTAATPISGAFANLPDGGTITSGPNTFRANYEGGDGNDLTLTVQ